MGSDSDNQDRVGYGRPPPEHQFQKGRSGNPKGLRSKPACGRRQNKGLKAEIIATLQQPIAVTEGGRRRRVSRLTALVKKLTADALNGDPKARAELLRLANQAEALVQSANAEDLIGAAKDAEILERFRDEVIKKYEGGDDD